MGLKANEIRKGDVLKDEEGNVLYTVIGVQTDGDRDVVADVKYLDGGTGARVWAEDADTNVVRLPATDAEGWQISEPPRGSVVMMHGPDGTATQRFKSDGLWRIVGRANAYTWAEIVSRSVEKPVFILKRGEE